MTLGLCIWLLGLQGFGIIDDLYFVIWFQSCEGFGNYFYRRKYDVPDIYTIF